jgi:hypothetical protein
MCIALIGLFDMATCLEQKVIAHFTSYLFTISTMIKKPYLALKNSKCNWNDL